MLVSHRDMISVYQMKMNDNEWSTITNLPGGNIRRMFIKKRPYDDVKARENE